MRLRKAPYTEFRRVSTSLDDYASVDSSPVFLVNNIPMMDMELKENNLISFMNPMCPQCRSRNVVRNGTCLRTMENGTVFRVQRYICNDCRYSFVARPPNYSYEKHYPDDVRKLTEGMSGKEIVEIMLDRIGSLYGGDRIMAGFLSFVRKHRKEVFLYLENPEVEKTSDLAEQHFSIQSWLFKHRFKTKQGLLRTSYWYHRYLSTGS
jgi:hypothetical protein